MPDYCLLPWVYFFFLQIKGQDVFWEREKKKKKKTIIAPLAILYMVNCTVYQDIEKVACEHPSRHDPETNQHSYLCPKIGPWKS